MKKLNISSNKLKSFVNFPDLPALEYLDASKNLFEKEDEAGKLRHLSKLNTLNMLECPVHEEKGDDLKREILISLDCLQLKMVNEEEITEEDVQDAKDVKEERIQAAKEAAEEAAREAAEREAER